MIRLRRDQQQMLTALATEHGATVAITTTNGSHWKATFTRGSASRFIIVSYSPRDNRVYDIMKADARRALRGLAGLARMP
jgi:hypothetical protein